MKRGVVEWSGYGVYWRGGVFERGVLERGCSGEGGVVERGCSGEEVQWRGGIVERRCSGEEVQWRGGVVGRCSEEGCSRECSGEGVQWRECNGESAVARGLVESVVERRCSGEGVQWADHYRKHHPICQPICICLISVAQFLVNCMLSPEN